MLKARLKALRRWALNKNGLRERSAAKTTGVVLRRKAAAVHRGARRPAVEAWFQLRPRGWRRSGWQAPEVSGTQKLRELPGGLQRSRARAKPRAWRAGSARLTQRSCGRAQPDRCPGQIPKYGRAVARWGCATLQRPRPEIRQNEAGEGTAGLVCHW